MATTGPMADFARLPKQRKVLIFVVIGFLLGGLYWQFLFKGLDKDIEDAENEHQGKVNQNTKMGKDILAYEQLKTQFSELQRSVNENQKALPTQAEVPAFFETLNRKVKDSGVETKHWTQLPEEPVDVFVKVPVHLEITGTFMQIKRFFASLVQKPETGQGSGQSRESRPDHERVVSIESLTLNDAKIVDHELILSAKFTATTYRQDEPKGKTPAVLSGDASAPPAGGTAAPPMPPSSTPTGAKLRTEDAMKKDQERSDTGVKRATEPLGSAGSGAARLKGGQ